MLNTFIKIITSVAFEEDSHDEKCACVKWIHTCVKWIQTSKGEGDAGRKALYKRLFCLLWVSVACVVVMHIIINLHAVSVWIR